MWQLPLHWAWPGVKDCPLSMSLPSPCFFNQLEPVGPAPRSGLGLEPASKCSPWPSPSSWASQCGDTHGDPAALPLMLARGGRRSGKCNCPCRDPARSNSFPAVCKSQSCGLNLLLYREKKNPYTIEINTDINTNNPITFVLTAW